MVTITQITVMDQKTGSGGHESCGYHTFKNTMLSMMRAQGIIDDRQLESMRKDKPLFEAIFNVAKHITDHANGDLDVSPLLFIRILEKAKAGDYDFSAHGVSKADLGRLNIKFDGSQGISVTALSTYPQSPEYAVGSGSEEELFSAAAIVKLARNKGVANHVFALALNNEHWVSAAVSQNTQGERTWQVMDSYNNQKTFVNSSVAKMEQILTKDEPALKAYLIEAYDVATDLTINRRYRNFFDESTGLPYKDKSTGWGPKNDQKWDATDYFIKQKSMLAEYTVYIENRMSFMESSGWLASDGVEEKARVTKLYNLTKFIYEHAEKSDVAAKAALKPICEKLKVALGKDDVLENIADKVKAPELPVVLVEPLVVLDVIDEPSVVHTVPTKPPVGLDVTVEPLGPQVDSITKGSRVDRQVSSAQFAVKHGQPKPTEGFAARFVTAIKAIWEGLKDAVEYVARSIGIVS